MKHYAYSAIAMLAIMLTVTSCMGNPQKAEAPVNTDTLALDTIYEPGRGDLGGYDLRGPVKKVAYDEWNCTFNEQGQLLTENGRSLKSIFPGGITRNKEGRLLECNADGYGSRYYTYNDKGLPTEIAEDGYNRKFTYDAEGYVKTEIKTIYPDMGDDLGADEEEKPEVTKSTYTIIEKDSYGNWTKRKNQHEEVTTRTITYF